MKKFYQQLKTFLINTGKDPRIPNRDKKILLTLIALIISPIDLIPDWIPFLGVLDDVIILAIVLDYFFDVLDQNILLTHYPWGMKSFSQLKKIAKAFSICVPWFIKNQIWSYKKDIY